MSNENNEAYNEKVPLSAKLGFGLETAGHRTMAGVGLGAIDIFYLKIYGLQTDWMILSWILFMVWNAINDPLIGIIQEKTKTKIGRRIPYLRYGCVPYALSFILIWFPFMEGGGQFGLFINHLLMLYIFDTLYSMTGLINYSLPAEMAVTSEERSNIIVTSSLFGAIGMILPMVLQSVLLGGDNPNKEFLQIVMIITAIVSGFMIFLSSYLIKENKYTLREETLGFYESIKETVKNKPFLILEIIIFGMVIVQEIIFSEIVFLFDYLIDYYNIITAIICLIPIAIMVIYFFIWENKNIPTKGIKKVTYVGAYISLVGFILLLILGLLFGSKLYIEITFIGLGLVFSGLVIFFMIQQNLMGDVIDNDEIRTGKRRETTYSGVNALFTKPAVSIAHGLFLFILQLFNYDETPGLSPSEQDPTVSTGVLIAFTIIPIICLIAAIIALKWYPLDGKEWNEKKKRIQEIHIQKEKEYVEYLKKNK
ncbi:MAG: hypothetical protein GY870_20820 [archaeon]|nr:hypothetical protein [archaeon]